jgi:tetratricopeptide (TPR) repeat protein
VKTFFTIITLCTVFSAFAAVECQMLLPDKEQKRILFERWWYPPGTKLRLSAAAIKDGYAALDKKDLDNAMREFNRAWRFNPENMDAYWGAAIVMGLYAEKAQNTAEAKSFIEKSLKLFELAHKNLSGDIIVKENFQLDYAASFYVAGKFFLESDKNAAEKYFLEAEKMWLPFLKNRDMKKQRDALVYYRTCWHLTKLYRDWGKQELYKKYLNSLPAALRKGL